jgi:uncharacterized RDD family membrane protein YckC
VLYARGIKLLLSEAIFSNAANYPVGLDLLLVSLPMLLYHLIMEIIFHGQSFGKRLMSIRVISLDGGEPDLGQYILRWIFRVWEWPLVFGFVAGSVLLVYQVLATCVFGIIVVIIIAVSNKSQRLGDIAAGTTVVAAKLGYSIDDTVFLDITPTDYKVIYPQVMRLSDRDINAIKTVIVQANKSRRFETAYRVAGKIKEVLQVDSDLDVIDFLEKLLADYNYLATKES